jgi:hypothetical protein
MRISELQTKITQLQINLCPYVFEKNQGPTQRKSVISRCSIAAIRETSARPPPAPTAASNQLVPSDINHRVDGRVRFAFKLMLKGMVESIAHGLALSQP